MSSRIVTQALAVVAGGVLNGVNRTVPERSAGPNVRRSVRVRVARQHRQAAHPAVGAAAACRRTVGVRR